MAAVIVGQLSSRFKARGDVLWGLAYAKVLICEQQLPGYNKEFDHIVVANLNDPDSLDKAILEVVSLYHIDVVYGLCELSVLPASYIRDKTGAKGIPGQTAMNCRNKVLMRQALGSAGVKIPRFYATGSTEDLSRIKQRVGGYPLICKPVMGFASQGVRRVDNDQQLIDAIRRIKRENKHVMYKYYQLGASEDCGKALIESFLPGKEIAIDGIVINSRAKMLLPIDKPDVSNGPFFADSLHIAPAYLSDDEYDSLSKTVQQAVTAVGLQNGPFHMEVRVDDNEVTVLEIAARIGFPRLIWQCLELDIVSLSQQVILGLEVTIDNLVKQYAGTYCINADATGFYRGIINLDELSALDNIVEIPIVINPGDRVCPPPEGNKYIGFVIAAGARYEDVKNTLYETKDSMIIDIH